MALIIKRPVVLKNIVTPTFKEQLTTELEQAIRQIDAWLEQEEFQSRRLIADAQKQDPRRANQLRENIKQERQRQEQVRNNLEQKLNQVKQLEVGSVFISGTYDSPVKVEVGADIRDLLTQAEIVVKDGIVVKVIE